LAVQTFYINAGTGSAPPAQRDTGQAKPAEQHAAGLRRGDIEKRGMDLGARDGPAFGIDHLDGY
jgi:hypothetical protein